VLRVAWVYSPFGGNFVKTMLRLAGDRDDLGVVGDQVGNPTSALAIADGILQVATNMVSGSYPDQRGIFHMTAQGEGSWADFAQAIFAAQKFSHNFGDKKFSQWIKEQGYQYAIVGENLAINFTASEPLLNAWLASPTHKKNILHQDYREIGVAVRTADWQGEEETLVVELFGAPPVLAEQLVPDTLEKQNSSTAILNPAQLITSNLAEQYLNNIAIPCLYGK